MIDGGLRRLFHSNMPLVHWQAVETGSTGLGVPDSNGCYNSIEFWVEFKTTETNAVPLRPEQIGWLMRRSRAGGLCWVAVRHKHAGGPRKGPPVDELWLYRGADAQMLDCWGLRHAPVGRWGGGPRRWPWPVVLGHLTGRQGPLALPAAPAARAMAPAKLHHPRLNRGCL